MQSNAVKFVLYFNIIFLFTDVIPISNAILSFMVILFSLFVIFINLYRNKKLIYSGPISLLISITLLTEFVSVYILGITSSMGYFTRYIFYILFIYLVINSSPFSRNDLNKIISVFAFFSIMSGLGGILLDNYIFLNGYDRLKGLTKSPVAICLISTIPIIIYIYSYFFYNLKLTILNKILLVMCFLIILYSGSRQPLMGIILLSAITYIIKSSYKSKVVLGITLVPVFSALFVIYFDEIINISRGIYQISILLSDPSQALMDPSSQSRLKYLQSTMEHWESYSIFLPSGFNSFSIIYAEQGFRPNTAFHNDLILPILEYGLIFALSNLFLLIYISKDRLKQTLFVFLIFTLCSSLNNTFYYTTITLCYIFLAFCRVEHENL